MRELDRPLSKKQLDFIDNMVHLRDIDKAALQVEVSAGTARGWMRVDRIYNEIERRREMEAQEKAKLSAARSIVTIEKIDKQLIKMIQVDAEKTPQLGTAKVRAIELGYRRVGALYDGNFIPAQGQTEGEVQAAPSIYRAIEATIITHSVETRREVTATGDRVQNPTTEAGGPITGTASYTW